MDGIEALQSLQARFNTLPDAMPGILKKSFQEIAPQIEDRVIAQLARGERGDGSNLPNYSPVSVNKFGKPPGPMNLHDKGPFWQGITAVVDDEGLEMVGRDSKSEMLQLRYGDNIIELQEESKDEMLEEDLARVAEEEIQKYFEL